MRDISILIILLAVAVMAWRQPWVGVLALVFLGVMHPQGYATGFMQAVPVYLALFAVVTVAAAWHSFRLHAWPRFFWDWRWPGLLLLWGQFTLSTALESTLGSVGQRLLEVTKILPLILLVLLLIDSRMKLTWMLLTIGLSLAMVMLKGGYWAFSRAFMTASMGRQVASTKATTSSPLPRP